MMADIHDDASVAAAIAGEFGVVNAVSIFCGARPDETFQSVHVENCSLYNRISPSRAPRSSKDEDTCYEEQ
jgi:hypothetical protein